MSNTTVAAAQVALGRGDVRKALSLYDKALRSSLSDAHKAQCHAGIGEALARMNSWPAAIQHLRRALELEQTVVPAHVLLGLGLRLQGQLGPATEHFDAALALAPEHVEALYQRGLLAKVAQDYPKALALLQRAHAVEPQRLDVLMELVFVKRTLCAWDGLHELEGRLVRSSLQHASGVNPREPVLYGSMARMLLDNDQDSFSVSRSLVLRQKPATLPIWPARKKPHARIRLGYLHSDANQHPTGLNLHGFFALHDRTRFEVFVYSFGKNDGSRYRKSVEEGAEHFVDLQGQDDDTVARRIARDEIDVLVDLMGLMANHKLGVLWRRPATTQLTYFADPGPVPGECLDYVIADPVVIPRAMRDAGHFGPTIWLSRCYFPACGQSLTERPQAASRAEQGLPEEAFVLASFNTITKLTPTVFEAWTRILHEAPGAVLWLLSGNDEAQHALQARFAACGLAPSRLVLAPFEGDYTRHLARLQAADLMLDMVPWGAHTTCADMLRAGVPVLTLTGNNFASRVGQSMNRAVGMPELTTSSLDEYVDKAVELARRGAADLKARLQDSSSLELFQPHVIVRELERAYVAAHEAVLARGKTRQALPHIELSKP